MDISSKTRLLVAVIAILMVLSVFAVYFDSPPQSSTANESNSGTTTAAVQAAGQAGAPLTADSVLNAISAHQVPTRFAYLPNFSYNTSASTAVNPMYTTSPAPIGVVDYGQSTNSGAISTYGYTTSGFSGSFMAEGFSPMYMQNNDPESMAIQLNTVLQGVTIAGVPGQVFWIQNVMLYTPSQNQMQFISNIWDFSTTGLQMPSDAILSGNGAVVPGMFYYYAGPIITVPDTFTSIVYVNSVLNGLNNAVTFSYEITGTESSSTIPQTQFDQVVFNSAVLGSTIPVPAAKFQVSGTQKAPSGMLYDAELVATGPGGGSTTSMYSANGQLKLQYLNSAGAYTNPSSAYSFGSNTGETIQGLSSWWTGGATSSRVDHLALGPSFLVPLWGSDVTKNGGTNIQGTIDPPNAFMFMNIGTSYNPAAASWGPIAANGTYKYALPGGLDYSGTVMMSEFQKYTFDPTALGAVEETNETESGPPANPGADENETSTYLNVSLAFDISQGIYTPLYANGNDQVKYLTVGNSGYTGTGHLQNITQNLIVGDGSPTDPYMIENNQHQRLDPLFAKVNDYMFPVFQGIQIMNTNVSIEVNSPPSFSVQYPTTLASQLAYYGLPALNSLPMMFYNTTGVTVYGANLITGWFAQTLSNVPAASVVFWNSQDFLVGDSMFSTMSNALLVYNSAGNGGGTVWGNHFMADPISMSTYAAGILNGEDPMGVLMYSSGNLVYNNYFDLNRSAYSPVSDLFGGSTVTYTNSWDLGQKYNLSYYQYVNNHNLSGADSVVAVNYQGGNFWYYYNGEIPYNDRGAIVLGGDNYPLIVPTYAVTFNNNGLPAGMTWSVTLDKETLSSTGSSITFQAVNGTHLFRISKPQNFSASPISGAALVGGEDIVKTIDFAPVLYPVTFTESGHPSQYAWSVTLNGQVQSSMENSITFMMDNGTYQYSIMGHQYYQATPSAGRLLVNGASASENIVFVVSHFSVTFVAHGLPEGGEWSIAMDGSHITGTADTAMLMAQNGTYTYTITPPDGYTAPVLSGTFLVFGSNLTVNVAFTPIEYNVTFSAVGLPGGTEWSVLLDGQAANSTTSVITFTVTAGNYSYSIPSIQGYTIPVNQSNVIVSDHDMNMEVQFSKIPNNGLTAGLMGAGAAIGVGAGVVIAYAFWRKP